VTDKTTGVTCDQTIILTGNLTSEKYPNKLRRIRYYNHETGNILVFITNNFKISALTVAALYRNRWGIESFFKWIKQHLKIQSFRGQSENAVKTQIWIAISTYMLVIIAKRKLNLKQSLYKILQLVSLLAFDKTPLKALFNEDKNQDVKEPLYNQLKIF